MGIYDGHGGSAVSQFLRQELHGLFEHVDKSHTPDVYAWAKELGGYFRRFNGGVLAPWIDPTAPSYQEELDLEARATLAFFEVSMSALATQRAFDSPTGGQGHVTRKGNEGVWCDRICGTSQVAGQLGILPIQPVGTNCCPCRVSRGCSEMTCGEQWP